jgi:hypothetical protein
LEGFEKVAKALKASFGKVDRETLGEWFQLRLAKSLKEIGETPVLEAKINNKPKDILIRGGKVHIECKSFRRPVVCNSVYHEYQKFFKTLRDVLGDGEWVVTLKGKYSGNYFNAIRSLQHDNFRRNDLFDIHKSDAPIVRVNVKNVMKHGAPELYLFGKQYMEGTKVTPMAYLCIPGSFGIKFIGPEIDFVNAFLSTLHQKYKQMIDGVCNVLALDVSGIVGDFSDLQSELIKAIQLSNYHKISAVLPVFVFGNCCKISGSIFKDDDSLGNMAESIFEKLYRIDPLSED